MRLVVDFFLVSGAALESVMQHVAPAQKLMLPMADFHVFFCPEGVVPQNQAGWRCGRALAMAGGEQCASTSEVWSVWEVMSQCGCGGHCSEFSLCAMLGVGGLATGMLALQ